MKWVKEWVGKDDEIIHIILRLVTTQSYNARTDLISLTARNEDPMSPESRKPRPT
jgi:hypothetical protein